MVEIEIEQVDVTIQKIETVAPKKVSVPVAVEDEEEFDEDIEIEFEDSDFSFDDPPPPPPEFIEELEDDEAIDFFAVQNPPKMVGGMKNLYKNLVYPSMARRAGKNGSVVLKFICSKTGKPTKITVLSERPKNLGFGAAAITALKKCVFSPGLQRDKPVPVRMKLPVKFKVQ
jgi:protein TonB